MMTKQITLPPQKINKPTRTRKKRTGKPGKVYFSEETQDAIVNYNSIECPEERSIIFQKLIFPALDKLAENLIHTYKFHNFETNYNDLKYDSVCFLHDKLSSFTKDRGKAFSFLTTCCLNFLIMSANQMKAKQRFNGNLDIIDIKRDLNFEYHEEQRQEDLTNFIDFWIEWNYNNLDTVYKPRERKVVDAVLTLFKSSHDLECFNKKYLYILIREQTNLTTSQITTTIKKMKRILTAMFREYNLGDYKWEAVKSFKKWKDIQNEKL